MSIKRVSAASDFYLKFVMSKLGHKISIAREPVTNPVSQIPRSKELEGHVEVLVENKNEQFACGGESFRNERVHQRK